ncbi:MAG: hypothetical protein KGH69_00785 [Candidatus Micrarchaeota archaeon]|nr:hypothetical protein [Candidatus Micrarchaeota archaeon]
MLVSGRASAAFYQDKAYCNTQVATGAYAIPVAGIELSLLAISLSFSVVAIAVMINRLVPSSGVSGWINNEYWELAKSVMLIAAIYGLLTFMSNIALWINPSPGINPGTGSYTGFASGTTYSQNIGGPGGLLVGAEGYMCKVSHELLSATLAMGQMSLGVKLLQHSLSSQSGLQIGAYTPIPIPLPPGFWLKFGFTAYPYASLLLDSGSIIIGAFASPVRDAVVFLLFPMTSLVVVVEQLLPALASIGLEVLIPLGLVLRAFPFARGVGGTAVAIGIGAAVVYPALLVLFNQPIDYYITSAYPISTVHPPYTCADAVSGIGGVGGTVLSVLCGGVDLTVGQIADSVYGLAEALPWTWHVFGPATPYLNFLIDNLFYIVLNFLLFALDLILMYPIVDSIARSLGGTIRFELGGKLRLA